MKRALKNAFRRFGFDLVRYDPSPQITRIDLASLSDLSEEERRTVAQVRPFTLTSVERIAALLNAVAYIANNKIPGDFAECGVWRGGSMMAVALALLA